MNDASKTKNQLIDELVRARQWAAQWEAIDAKRKRVEEAFQESETEYRSTVNDLLVGVVVHAADTSIVLSNPIAHEMLGLTYEQMSGKKAIDPAWNFVHENLSVMKVEDYPVSRVISTGEPLRDYVAGIMRPDRDYLTWVNVNATPIFFSDGELQKIVVNFADITELKQMEETLRESEQKYRSLITNIPDVTWTTNSEGNTVFISPNVEEVYGYSPEEFYRGSDDLWLERIHLDDVDKTKNAYRSLFEKGKGFDVEYRIKRKDGKWIWLHDRSINTYEKDGSFYADGVFFDITERKRAEEALQKAHDELESQVQKRTAELSISNEELQRKFTELKQTEEALRESEKFLSESQISANIGSWVWYLESGIAVWSEQLYKIYGRNTDLGVPSMDSYLEAYHPDDREPLQNAMEMAINKAAPYNIDYRIFREDSGEERWIRSIGKLEKDANGKPNRLIGIAQDITDRRQMEEALRTVEEQLHSVVHAAPLILWGVDSAGQITLSEGSGLEALGLQPGEVVGQSVYDVYRDYPDALNAIDKAMSGELSQIDVEVGDRIWNNHYQPIQDVDGSIIGITGISVDITDRKRAEEEASITR
ncbi:MAG: PAS domain S-box protein [Chloroflexi bacterium]|nr:PAS domain S-box protein [Chloroflexota bacterium]